MPAPPTTDVVGYSLTPLPRLHRDDGCRAYGTLQEMQAPFVPRSPRPFRTICTFSGPEAGGTQILAQVFSFSPHLRSPWADTKRDTPGLFSIGAGGSCGCRTWRERGL